MRMDGSGRQWHCRRVAANYRSLRAGALHDCEVPDDFAKWPSEEQGELVRLAEASRDAAQAQALRLSKMKPALESTLDRGVQRQSKFCEALRAARAS